MGNQSDGKEIDSETSWNENPSSPLVETDEEEQIQKYAKDRGYSWLIALTSLIVYCIFCGLRRSEGIFFLTFRTHFDMSAQTAAWLGAVLSSVQFLSSPFATAFINRFSIRTAFILAGLLCSTGFVMTAFVTNIFVLFFTYSIVQGFSRGLSLAPALVLVSQYFKRRRGLAMAIASSGCGVGGALLLPLIQWIVDLYGYTGTFLILAGATSHALVCGFLARPITFHMKLIRLDWKYAKYGTSDRRGSLAEYDVKENYNFLSKTNENGVHEGNSERVEKGRNNEHFSEKKQRDAEPSSTDEDEFFTPKRRTKTKTKTLGKHEYSPLISEIEKAKERHESPPKRKAIDVYKLCLRHIKESLSICFPIDTYDSKDKSKTQVFHFSILKDPAYIFICLSVVCYQQANKITYDFFPVKMYEKGFNDAEVAFIQACIQVFDVLGKIICGFTFDLPALVRFQTAAFVVMQLITAVCVALVPNTNEFAQLCALGGLAGFAIAAVFNLRILILADLLGDEVLSSSLGLMLFFQGFTSLAGTPTAGALKDAYGSFDYAFYLCAVSFSFAAIFGLGSIVIVYKRSRPRESECSGTSGTESSSRYFTLFNTICSCRKNNNGEKERKVSIEDAADDYIPLVEKQFVQP